MLVSEPVALERLLAASRLGGGGGGEGSGGGDGGGGDGGGGEGGGDGGGEGGVSSRLPRQPLIAVMALVAISEAELGNLEDADRREELEALTLAVQHPNPDPKTSPNTPNPDPNPSPNPSANPSPSPSPSSSPSPNP